jgi:hypothetical protein
VVTVKKTDAKAIVALSDGTKIERKRDFRLRHADMDITAMVPGLTIDVEGEGNAKQESRLPRSMSADQFKRKEMVRGY